MPRRCSAATAGSIARPSRRGRGRSGPRRGRRCPAATTPSRPSGGRGPSAGRGRSRAGWAQWRPSRPARRAEASCCGARRPERRSPRPTGGARWAPRAVPLHSCLIKRTGKGVRVGCVTSCAFPDVVVLEPAGSGRICTHLCTRCGRGLPDVPQTGPLVWGTCYNGRDLPDSAARRPGRRRVVTTEGLSDGAALDRPGGSDPARGFPVERLQDARGRRVPASTGSTAQRQPPLAAGGGRRLGRSAQMRRRAPWTLPCPGGGRDRAMAQLSTVRGVAIQQSVSRPTVRKMLDRGVFPRLPETDRSTTCLQGVTGRQRRHAVGRSKPAAAPTLFAGGPPIAKE